MTDTASHILGIFAAAAAGEEQWVQLIPMGEIKGRDGRGPYQLPNMDAAEAVIHATLRHHGEADIVIDYDHQSDFGAKAGVGGVAPAAGWITELAARDDGTWGRVEWTDAAAAKLRTREYRYLSPVFLFDKVTGAVAKVLRAGLTNNPNLHLKAVASADMSNPDHLSQLRSIFGLSETADLGAVVEAARAQATAINSAVDPTKFVPIEVLERVTAELNQRDSLGLSAEASEIAVNSAISTGRMPPALRDWGLSLCQSDKGAFDAFLDKTGKAFSPLFRTGAAVGDPGQITTHAATAAEAEVAHNLGLSVDQLKA